MSKANDTDTLDAIVGLALRALVESGADAAYVGRFAATHRQDVARVLGQDHSIASPVDIETVIQQAVRAAMTDLGLAQAKTATRPAKVRINVRVRGHRTTVSLDNTVLERLRAVQPSTEVVEAVLNQLANQAPQTTKNRSAWVERRLLHLIESGTTISAQADSIRH